MEAIKTLFEGQELSEEFVTKATAIVEAQIADKQKELQESYDNKVKALEEETASKLEEEVSKLEGITSSYISEEVIPEIDKYLTMAVKEWLEENKIELESKVKVTMAESVLEGIHGVLSENNMKVNVEQDSIVENLQKQIDEIQSKLDETISEKADLNKEISEMKRSSIVDGVCSDLTESQKEKIAESSKSVEFKNEEQFEIAVKGLVESYFPANAEDNKADKITESNEAEQLTESNNYYEQFSKAYK